MVYLVGLVRSFSVVLGLLGCVLRATTKKGHFFRKSAPQRKSRLPLWSQKRRCGLVWICCNSVLKVTVNE